jgi:hypothetical protein
LQYGVSGIVVKEKCPLSKSFVDAGAEKKGDLGKSDQVLWPVSLLHCVRMHLTAGGALANPPSFTPATLVIIAYNNGAVKQIVISGRSGEVFVEAANGGLTHKTAAKNWVSITR